MIYLYSGTPGSGKSLNTAREIYAKLKYGNKIILCNFPINLEKFKPKARERFYYVDNSQIKPDFLIKFANDYWKEHPADGVRQVEGKIKLYIDESQILFNAREWQKTYKDGWVKFFSLHRHLGYDIILITQFDRMLDRQIRSLIEYEYVHRKVSNIGVWGKIFNIAAGGGLFYVVQKWYPQKERVGGEFFKFSKKYDNLYDTHAIFNEDGLTESVTTKRE